MPSNFIVILNYCLVGLANWHASSDLLTSGCLTYQRLFCNFLLEYEGRSRY